MATDRRIERLRLMVMFVIAWLVGTVVFEVVREAVNGSIGFIAAAVAVGVSMYARRRVAIRAEHRLSAHFWSFLPLILFVAIPAIVKIITFLTDDENKTWSAHLYSLVPIVVRLGVPVVALLWIHFNLGRMSFGDPAGADDGASAN